LRQEPAREILTHSQLFFDKNKINIPLLQNHLTLEGRINISDVVAIINAASAIFKTEPNVLDISGEVRAVGDLHGFLW
jgi:serine/threonine-protein phosphatase 2B catalytic subunit